jgi:hypothetical protein
MMNDETLNGLMDFTDLLMDDNFEGLESYMANNPVVTEHNPIWSDCAVAPDSPVTEHDQEDVGERDSFPMDILQALSDDELKDIIYWNEDGMSFVVKIPTFKKTVLGKYFDNIKWESFRTNLNRYDFKSKNKQKNTVVIVRHRSFRRDQPDLCKTIRPRPISKKK